MLRAMLAHTFGASRVHCASSRRTSARRWLKRACKISAVICAPLTCSRLPCVTIAGDAMSLVDGLGMTSTPTLSRGAESPVASVSEAWPVDACTWSAT
eukprot:3075280-Pleurochrysis_carterae.AAC.1